jgi:hypothetical protein
MANWLPGIVITNGSIASAAYLTSAISVSGYCSGASVLLGNYASSTGQSITEITLGNNLLLSTTGVLSTTTNVAVTGTLTATGAVGLFSTCGITGAVNLYSTVQASGAVTLLSTLAVSGAITPSVPINLAGGGTNAGTSAAANQTLQPPTVTITETGGAIAINAASGSNFYCLLNGTATVSYTGFVDGQTVTVVLQNTTSNYTVSWPTTKWSGGTAPTMTTGAHFDLYNITYVAAATAYFGTYVQNF